MKIFISTGYGGNWVAIPVSNQHKNPPKVTHLSNKAKKMFFFFNSCLQWGRYLPYFVFKLCNKNMLVVNFHHCCLWGQGSGHGGGWNVTKVFQNWLLWSLDTLLLQSFLRGSSSINGIKFSFLVVIFFDENLMVICQCATLVKTFPTG